MIEVLSPAGTYESFQAAISAGADAVYLGGSMFGARAFAGNFNKEELCSAIEYAHMYDRKVYLTVNTLLKEEELNGKLYDYLLPYYERGLDAVIVQDFGVFRFIRRNFPGLDIHASTQMTISGHLGAALIGKAGASRIVTPRELTLEEISVIRRENPELEIESFVHGALCYCYSGQCLMSSLIGGRSGNRGRCAQSCRLPYDAYWEEQRQNSPKERYILSPKDMCALENLPRIIEAGVNSLKIEGRMKSPEYTAGVVSMYRKYVDQYLQKGAKNYRVSEEDLEILMDLYNRGNFTRGYYAEKPGKSMMSMERPNHQGVRALEVMTADKGSFTARPLTKLHGGDVIEITPDYEITIGAKDVDRKQVCFRIPAKFAVKKGQILYRTRNQELMQKIRSEYVEGEAKIQSEAFVYLHKGEPAGLMLTAKDVQVCVKGASCEKAENRPVSGEQVERQLLKLGNTRLMTTDIRVEMDEDIFIPMGAINELRRTAVETLEKALAERFYRNTVDKQEENFVPDVERSTKMQYSVYVTRAEQIPPILESNLFSRVYLDAALLNENQWKDTVMQFHGKGMEVFFAFPGIFREKSEKYLVKLLPVLRECGLDGYLVRSLCQIKFILENNLSGKIISDHNLYAWNHEAMAFLSELGVDGMTIPLELNEKELDKLNPQGMELVGYGYYPMMISAQCVRKNLSGCKLGTVQEKDIWKLVDRKENQLPVMSDCKNCITTIYNMSPVNLLDYRERFEEWKVSWFRVEFTVETKEQTRGVLELMKETMNGNGISGERYTRGHFARGVE